MNNWNQDSSSSSPSVKDFFIKTRESLPMEAPLHEVGFQNKIKADASGNVFSNLQVLGRREGETFALLPSQVKETRFVERVKRGVAAIIFSEGCDVPAETLELARRFQIAIFCTDRTKQQVVTALRRILSGFFPKRIIVSGGLLEIFGLGVLIMGDSGVGKSESALELISRGSLFVSDDVTQVEKTKADTLRGKAPALSQNFMEIRGLSIINIERIFGSEVVNPEAAIDLVINLERWEPGKEYDRLGLEKPEKIEILGVEIPQITIPVAPGRTIGTLIEVACKVHILRKKGYHAPREMAQRLEQAINSKSNG
jgi:HPr kinase/phosphorylase